MSPIEFSTSPTAATASSGETRWIPAGFGEGALAGMRIGAVLHPAVLLAFADGARLLQTEIAQPRSVRIAGLLRNTGAG